MKVYTLRSEMLVRRPLEEVFPFFAEAGNLGRITPPWLNFRIITSNVDMRPGAVIDYKIHLLGIPMNWRTLITEYDPPRGFVDQQTKGPYAKWVHRHTFRSVPEGTMVGDQVDYALPFGPLGQIAHALMVRFQLQAIFGYRQKALAEVFSGATESVQEPVIAGK